MKVKMGDPPGWVIRITHIENHGFWGFRGKDDILEP